MCGHSVGTDLILVDQQVVHVRGHLWILRGSVCVCVGVFWALQLLRLLSALIVYASSAQLRTGIIDDVKTDAT